MKIKYLAHASFLITTQNNTRIITDPYNVGQGIHYQAIRESADIVTVSHGHGDHSNAKSIPGKPLIIQTAGQQTVRSIKIKGVSVYHDEAKGSKRGNNLIFCFNTDGINLCHAGDLGHLLTPEEIAEIGPVDILMIPAGGFYTLPPKEIPQVVSSLAPKVVIPMHYKTPGTDYPINTVDEFLLGQKNARRLDTSEIEFNAGKWPASTEIIVLKPSLLGK